MKLAVILPHKDREVYKEFQKVYLTEYLKAQNIEHKVYFVEQKRDGLFNRAKSINVGVKFAEKDFLPEYLVISDIDMVPINIEYSYAGFAEVWFGNAGGVKVLLSDFMAVNGFNNKFEGWGYEDSEFWNRLNVLQIKNNIWKLYHPEAELVDLELRSSDTKIHSKEYYGIPNPPRFFMPSEKEVTRHIDVLYPKTWLFPYQKQNNANLCDSIKKKPQTEAIDYFRLNGVNEISLESIGSTPISDTVTELYWE